MTTAIATRRPVAVLNHLASGISQVGPSASGGVVYDSRSGSPNIIKDSGGYQGVDATHNYRLRFTIGQNVQMIQRVLLYFSLAPWRASQQSTAAAGTSGASSSTSSGASSASSSGAGAGAANPHFHTLPHDANPPAFTLGLNAVGNTLEWTGSGNPGLQTDLTDISAHAHGIAHNHDISHTHGIPSLSLNAPSGLIDQALAQGVHVLIAPAGGSFIDITSALGGPWGTGTALDLNDVDISPYITAGGTWEIQLSSVTLGGIIATVAVNGIVGAL